MSTISPTVEAKVVKVLLVEDHLMFREWLAQLIVKSQGFTICGECDNILTAAQIAQEERPDIAVVDISLHGASGLEFIKNLKAQGLEIPILILSMHEESLYAERAIRAGAKGYITKHAASATLLHAMQQVLNGQVYLSDYMTSTMLASIGGKSRRLPLGGIEQLTDRELEIFHLLGKGYNIRQIAKETHLSHLTVETYRAKIREKLRMHKSPDVSRRAARWLEEEGTRVYE